jgi:ActR/RegA family two-component response regulator
VIADLRLARMDDEAGLELLAAVRERWPSTRTILLTAYGSSAIEREARRRGVDVLLHKPRPLPEVARIVEALLGSGPASRPPPPGQEA